MPEREVDGMKALVESIPKIKYEALIEEYDAFIIDSDGKVTKSDLISSSH